MLLHGCSNILLGLAAMVEVGYHDCPDEPSSSETSSSESDNQQDSPLSRLADKISLKKCKITACCQKEWCCGRKYYSKRDIQIFRNHFASLAKIDQRQFIKNRLDEGISSTKRFHLDEDLNVGIGLPINARKRNRVCCRYFKQALGISNDKVTPLTHFLNESRHKPTKYIV